jgi:hypothetical protein
MKRKTTIHVSGQERERLKKYRKTHYDSGIPLGLVLDQLLDEVEEGTTDG